MDFKGFPNAKAPIVFFGRLIDSKGVDVLIRAVDIIERREPELVPPLWIVGGNHQEIEMIKKNITCSNAAKRLESRQILFWWGHIPHDVLPYLLAKCGIFCFTSKYEPGGRTILEAMASGLVVLATPQGFAEDVIEDGYNGYIVRNNSPETWAAHLQNLLRQPEVCAKIALNAKATIKSRFSMQSFFDKHWKIYESLLP